jgi:hypothetical protein
MLQVPNFVDYNQSNVDSEYNIMPEKADGDRSFDRRNLPEYVAKFEHNPIGLIKTEHYTGIYCHTSQSRTVFCPRVDDEGYQKELDEIEDSTVIVESFCNVLVFDHQRGIAELRVKTSKVLSQQEVANLMGSAWVPNISISLGSVINFNDRYVQPRHSSALLGFSMYSRLEDLTRNEMVKFQIGKSKGMFATYRGVLKKFVLDLPQDIVKTMNRHLSFRVEVFNFLYAGGCHIKRRQRKDAINAYPFLFFNGSFNSKGFLAIITEHLNSDRPLIDLIKSEFGTKMSLLRRLHGISIQKMHAKKFLHAETGWILSFLSDFEQMLPKNPSRKHFYIIYSCIQASRDIKRRIMQETGFVGTMGYDSSKKIDLWIMHFGNKAISSHEDYKETSKDVLYSINSIRDYLFYLIHSFKLDEKTVDLIIQRTSAGEIKKLSNIWHSELYKIREISDRAKFIVFYGRSSESILKAPTIIDKPQKLDANHFVVPLLTQEELILESKVMDHCVDGYFKEISTADSYLFSLRETGRTDPIATIEINSNPMGNNDLTIVQIRGFQNETVDDVYIQMFTGWFEKNAMGFRKKNKKNKDVFNKNREIQRTFDAISYEAEVAIAKEKLSLTRQLLPIVLPKSLKKGV